MSCRAEFFLPKRNVVLKSFHIAFCFVLLIGCISGCSSGSGNPSPSAPASLVYPQISTTATSGVAITANTPTVVGTVTSYTVSPALPTGLSLNAATGTISGTPIAVTAQASYTITAANSVGSTTAAIQIIVVAPIVAPSNLVYPQTTITATANQAITTDTPTFTGTAPTFAVAPTLPAGISLSASTGVISGTPTAASAQTTYTITATNSAGSTTATVKIQVNPAIPAPSNLVYPQTTISTVVGFSITTDIASVTGIPASFTISPTLPAGLALDPGTGALSGTPTAVAAQVAYTVTATNVAGSTTASLVITVGKAVTTLLDLGHANQIYGMRSTGTRLLSEDTKGHWVLWDEGSTAELASGDQGGFIWGVDIAGSVVAIGLTNGLELRSSIDGHLLTTIASPLINTSSVVGIGWWKLASDGTYVSAGTKAGMAVWNISGQLLASRQGDYSAAQVFAAPGQVQVALGAAGANVIEDISTTTGLSATSLPSPETSTPGSLMARGFSLIRAIQSGPTLQLEFSRESSLYRRWRILAAAATGSISMGQSSVVLH
jgi:Putative Ig domain